MNHQTKPAIVARPTYTAPVKQSYIIQIINN